MTVVHIEFGPNIAMDGVYADNAGAIVCLGSDKIVRNVCSSPRNDFGQPSGCPKGETQDVFHQTTNRGLVNEACYQQA